MHMLICERWAGGELIAKISLLQKPWSAEHEGVYGLHYHASVVLRILGRHERL